MSYNLFLIVAEEGIFRVNGTQLTIDQFKQTMSPLKQASDVFFPLDTDPLVVADLLKAFFRDLPSSFIKYINYYYKVF
jgi:hypothetical protein